MRMPRGTTSALSSLSECYAHMFPLGKALAAGIVIGEGGELPAEFASPAAELQSQLGMRFGEHAELAVDAMRSGISNYPDFPVAAATLDQNTREITAMIESVFGGESARSFQALWSDHIDAFVAYTQALAQKDEAAQQAAQDRLPGSTPSSRASCPPPRMGATWNGRAGGCVRHA